MTTEYVSVAGLKVAKELYDFIENEALVLTDLDKSEFWEHVSRIFTNFSPENTRLLQERDKLQKQLDDWYLDESNKPFNQAKYNEFLTEIGYIQPEPPDFEIDTHNIDDEISVMCGPQLVVPVLNTRFLVNAANARWGSLYDALYGTDAISESDGAEKGKSYNPVRGKRVIATAKKFLDNSVPLEVGSHSEVTQYCVENGNLVAYIGDSKTGLADTDAFIGYTSDEKNPKSILFLHNGLHIDVQIDRDDHIGKDDPAGVKDVILESAITAIIDFEDSISAVDAADKVIGYRNWLKVNQGILEEKVEKNGKTVLRTLNKDRKYTDKDGKELILPGRSLLFVRNVGHLMKIDAILDENKQPVYEGILDAIVTSLTALPGIDPKNPMKNSRSGSIYIVKPKMHGAKEVRFACAVLDEVEKLLKLAPNTIKIGVMDEERRTSVNLKDVIKEAKDRIAFINTGFLDRTGDEIHTSLLAGAMVPKSEMKAQTWLKTYENSNVDISLHSGFTHKAQIGKGMWAFPDLMAALLEQKINHPKAGATTAWVPSPTAGTLHATHYHEVDVFERQHELQKRDPADIEEMLILPLAKSELSEEEIQKELDNNCQSILGYVVRWIDQGIGCSKVLDIHNIGLMEDKATLRISSQLLANWLYHGVISEEQVIDSLKRMAIVVDKQNEGDSNYYPMSPNYDESIAFDAAKELILKGNEQPNGYTEPILHAKRIEYKKKHPDRV